MKPEIVWFNAISLVVTLGVSALLFDAAAMPEEKRLAASEPLPMEAFGEVDLGPDFGSLPVEELVGYYLENPPVQTPGAAPKQLHFGGC